MGGDYEADKGEEAATVLISKHYGAYLLSATFWASGEEDNIAFGSLARAKRYAREEYAWAGKQNRSWERPSDSQWRLTIISEGEEEAERGAFDGMFSIDHGD